MVRHILFFSLLSLAAASDLKKRIIPDRLSLLLAAVSLVPPGQVHPAGMLVALPLFLAGITTGGIGGGDVKIVMACGLVLGTGKAAAGLFVGLCLLVMFHAVWQILKKREKKVQETQGQAYPLVPFLLAGMLISVMAAG